MTSSASDLTVPMAVAVSVTSDALVVTLSDGRSISVPLAWYPRLQNVGEAERKNVRLIGRGTGLHWPDVEEDISVESILKGRASMESATSLKRWLAARGSRPTPP